MKGSRGVGGERGIIIKKTTGTTGEEMSLLLLPAGHYCGREYHFKSAKQEGRARWGIKEVRVGPKKKNFFNVLLKAELFCRETPSEISLPPF